MAPSTAFLEAVAGRRSVYAITKESPIPNDRILEIVNEALKNAPSPFDVRSTRCIVLFGQEHEKLWEYAYEATEQSNPQAFGILGPKLKAFVRGYGTCIFFDDAEAYNDLSPRFAALSKVFPEWEEHSSGMHQLVVWTALSAEGLGCSLQHYQPAITPYLAKTYDVPASWTPKAQLVFGKPNGPAPAPKSKTHLEKALRSYGA